MKSVTRYVCEICGKVYDDEAGALACEARGSPDTSHLKLGCIDCDHSPGAFYRECVFALASVLEGALHPEDVQILALACRDNVHGDHCLLVGPLCSGNSWFRRGRPAKPDFNKPALRRMVKALRDQGIEPTLWDGEKAVPLPESCV